MFSKINYSESIWLGRTFKFTLLLIFLVELLSFLTHWLNSFWPVNNAIFVCLVIVITCLSFYRLQYGIYLALIELFIGSQGHYFDFIVNGQRISIRMALFGLIMASFVYHAIHKKDLITFIRSFIRKKYLIVLATICVFGFISALLYGNSMKNIFNDFNAWFYFLYLMPFAYLAREYKEPNSFWAILSASITAVALKSLFFLYVFSHQFNNLTTYLYDWGRDTRWGEFTLVSGGLYRIFSQAQIYALIGTLILLTYVLFNSAVYKEKKLFWALNAIIALNLAAVILSLSRSYWVGLGLAGIALLFFILFYFKIRIKNFFRAVGTALIIFLFSGIILCVVIFFPFPQQTMLQAGSALNARFDVQDQAGASRWNQLPQLFKAATRHPFLGSGWGTTITYESRDPRIINPTNPLGRYTTYAFEWGYLDIILKIGLVGLAIYAIFIFQIIKRIFELIKNKKGRYNNALLLGLFLGLLALIATHMFSPYLNHPLGIGYLVILYVITIHIDYSKMEPIKS